MSLPSLSDVWNYAKENLSKPLYQVFKEAPATQKDETTLSDIAGSIFESPAKRVYDTAFYVKDQLENHTIIGRMVNHGDSIFGAVKNDFLEDNVIGRMIQGEDLFTALKNARK